MTIFNESFPVSYNICILRILWHPQWINKIESKKVIDFKNIIYLNTHILMNMRWYNGIFELFLFLIEFYMDEYVIRIEKFKYNNEQFFFIVHYAYLKLLGLVAFCPDKSMMQTCLWITWTKHFIRWYKINSKARTIVSDALPLISLVSHNHVHHKHSTKWAYWTWRLTLPV